VVWVGVQQQGSVWEAANGRTVDSAMSDWAPGQPTFDGACVVADQALGFQWRVASCAEVHPFICAMRVPNCPDGYTFLPWISEDILSTSRSCYKVTELGSYSSDLADGIRYMWHVT